MILSTKSNVASTLLPFWQQCRTKFSHFHKVETNWTLSKWRNFIKTFDTVAINGNIVAKKATMSKQHSTLSKERYFTINSFDIMAVLFLAYSIHVQTWRHPQNRKHITCRTDVRAGMSHGQRYHVLDTISLNLVTWFIDICERTDR